ncbi:MAG: hypothetical protein LBI69_02130 [Puniceicoccales bacterium]|nr:hypothetical protein [Puniceicoccales bacterium]
MQFRTEDFFRDAEKVHLTFDETWAYSQIPDGEVRQQIGEILLFDSVFSKTLDGICENVVGRTLFRLLATKSSLYRGGKKMQLRQYEGKVSLYSRKDFSVMTNLAMFDEQGNGLSSRQYYYVNGDGEIDVKSKTISMALFHEFCHALHDMEQLSEMKESGELHRTNAILGEVWDSAEELRTISGCIYGVDYDPICDHCFDLCESINRGCPFTPRYSHRGYDSATPSLDEKLERSRLLGYHCESRHIMEGWKKYVL